MRGSIGLIGVGLLGTSIARRLLDSGFEVLGYDVRPERLNLLSSYGGEAAGTAEDVFARCDEIVLSLPHSSVCEEILRRNKGHMRRGQIVIDTSTGDPEQMIGIGSMLGEMGINYIEAMVAGSSEQVLAGEALLFVGGEERAVTDVRGIFEAISSKWFYLGPVGSASRFKLVHNLVLGLNRAALAEGLAFAERLGFDPARTLEILKMTPAASKVMETKGGKMVSGDYKPQARLSQHLKDVRLILSEARRHGIKLPLSLAHERLLEEAEALGLGDADNSAVIEVYRLNTGEVSDGRSD